MSWQIGDLTAYVPIRLHNTMLDETYPEGKEFLLGVLDTGFSGFVLLPPRIFDELRLDEMKPIVTQAILADGRKAILKGVYGSFSIPELDFFDEGLIETASGVAETIIGMEALGRLRLELDGCSRRLNAHKC